LGTVLSALERSGAWGDTVVLFTSDHGDMCGSHGLRSKGPFVYDEIMRVPLYARGPGIPAGASSGALSSHVDLLRTIAGFAGAAVPESVLGVDQSPVLRGEAASARDHVLFQHGTAHTQLVEQQRWAIRGFFDGRTKYARYYGIGGGLPNDRLSGTRGEMLYGPDAAFEDQDHEWYDLAEDPHELTNLAMDRSRRKGCRDQYERLLELERTELGVAASRGG
jgi:arylsulfatase A-like enzyme